MDPKVGDQNLRLLLRSMCLRRTRVLLDLPNAEDQTISLSLSTEERHLYSQIIEDTKRKIDDDISSRSIPKAYNGILQAILRLRLLCNNGTQELSDAKSEAQDSWTEDGYVDGDKSACPFCSCEVMVSDGWNDLSPGSSPRNLPHSLCSACLSPNDIGKTRSQKKPKKQRPTSSRLVRQIDATDGSSPQPHCIDRAPSTSLRSQLLPNGKSSKLSALVSNIQGHRQGNKRYFDLHRGLRKYQH